MNMEAIPNELLEIREFFGKYASVKHGFSGSVILIFLYKQSTIVGMNAVLQRYGNSKLENDTCIVFIQPKMLN